MTSYSGLLGQHKTDSTILCVFCLVGLGVYFFWGLFYVLEPALCLVIFLRVRENVKFSREVRRIWEDLGQGVEKEDGQNILCELFYWI